jgi:hypothetical protein
MCAHLNAWVREQDRWLCMHCGEPCPGEEPRAAARPAAPAGPRANRIEAPVLGTSPRR